MSFVLHVERRPGRNALPLVFLHGWGMNLRVFDLLRDDLGADWETWAVDLAGHGASPWEQAHAGFDAQVRDVLAVLPDRCVLAGWSLGAKLAIEIAAREPSKIASLILLAASPKFAHSDDWPHGMDRGALRAFREVLAQNWQQTLSDFVWLQLRGSRNAEAARSVLEAALASQGAPHPEGMRNGLELLDQVDLRARVAQLAQRTLIICGQNDRVTSPDAARWLASALPDAELVEIARAGHAPFVSHHEEVAAAVRAFLGRCSVSEASAA